MKLFILILFLMSVSVQSKTYPLSDHYNGETFFNPENHHLKSFLDVLKWKLTAHPVKWPSSVPNKSYLLPALTSPHKAVLTFINHATFLIQLPGLTILTDPVFSERVSPFRFAGPKRARAPGVEFEKLPPIDVVLVSHNHYDHMDLETLTRLDAKFHPLFLVPLGDQALLRKEGIQNVREMDWWEEQKVKDVKLIFAPSQHWSSRSPFDRCKSLWGGFFIENEQTKIFFAGDTGLGSHFRDIKVRLGAPDFSLLPIGAYEPRHFMKSAHMNPDDAVRAHQDLGSAQSFGMHFGTFQLTDEGIDDPVEKLQEALNEHHIPKDLFRVLDQGESFTAN